MARHQNLTGPEELIAGLAGDLDDLAGAVVVTRADATRLAGTGAEPDPDAVAAIARATQTLAGPNAPADCVVTAAETLTVIAAFGDGLALGAAVPAGAVAPAVIRWLVARHVAGAGGGRPGRGVDNRDREPDLGAPVTPEPLPAPGETAGFDFEGWLADYTAGGGKD